MPVTLTPCHHEFHTECLNNWLQLQSLHSNDATCPICRNNLSDLQNFLNEQENLATLENLKQYIHNNLYTSIFSLLSKQQFIASSELAEEILYMNNVSFTQFLKNRYYFWSTIEIELLFDQFHQDKSLIEYIIQNQIDFNDVLKYGTVSKEELICLAFSKTNTSIVTYLFDLFHIKYINKQMFTSAMKNINPQKIISFLNQKDSKCFQRKLRVKNTLHLFNNRTCSYQKQGNCSNCILDFFKYNTSKSQDELYQILSYVIENISLSDYTRFCLIFICILRGFYNILILVLNISEEKNVFFQTRLMPLQHVQLLYYLGPLRGCHVQHVTPLECFDACKQHYDENTCRIMESIQLK
jgi:hypothetical protein